MKVGSLLAQVFEGQRSAVEGQRSAVEDQRSAVEDQRSAVEDQRSAVEDRWSDERPQQWAYFIYDRHGCFLGSWYV